MEKKWHCLSSYKNDYIQMILNQHQIKVERQQWYKTQLVTLTKTIIFFYIRKQNFSFGLICSTNEFLFVCTVLMLVRVYSISTSQCQIWPWFFTVRWRGVKEEWLRFSLMGSNFPLLPRPAKFQVSVMGKFSIMMVTWQIMNKDLKCQIKNLSTIRMTTF